MTMAQLHADLFVAALVVLVIIVLFIAGWIGHIKAMMNHHGHLFVLWRWFSGGLPPWVRNDADRRYRHMYDPGSVHYHFKARAHRAGIRTGLTIGPPLFGMAFLTDAQPLWFLVFVMGAGLMLEAAWRVYRLEKVRGHRKHATILHRAVAPHANRPLHGGRGGSRWIRFTDPKRQAARFQMPKNWNGTPEERGRFVQVVTETMGWHPESDAEWHLEGDDSYVDIKNRKAPPPEVSLADIALEIEKAGEDAVVLGLGRGDLPVKVSLAADSPHFGLSIGAGGGKSVLARLVAAQVLHNGGIVLILDPKRISHAWAKGLPNVRYAASTDEIHAALIWLSNEIEIRTRIADRSHDVEGNILANVGPRLLVIAEELNEMNARLRVWWNDNRAPTAPKKSPAITAMETALFMGRQVRVNIFAVAQMMTALAAGSGAARENMGVRILGRYTKNNWRMLVPEFDMPRTRTMKPGHIQVVTAIVRECQAAMVGGREARDFASSGQITPFPKDTVNDPRLDPEARTLDPSAPALTRGSSDSEAIVEAEIVQERQKVTLQEVADKGIVPMNGKALRNAAFRDPEFPEHCGIRLNQQGRPKEYWRDEIETWFEGRAK